MRKILKPKYQDDTVLDILRRQNIFLCADCGGKGTCGRCRVRFTDVSACPVPSEAESALISDEDLAEGIRLACQAVAFEGAEIEIPASSLLHESSPSTIDVKKIEHFTPSEVVAVDYGTTMIQGALVDLNNGVENEASIINHQKAYGADVISRIAASNDGYGEEMRKVAMEDLAELTERLGRDSERARYVISGNTVMGHIISGYSLRGLGEFPYTPVDISLRRDENITFLPGISAFVGADIVSGICACSLDKAEAPWLYVDIGTNGEMALGTGEEILAASAPAGPAFEGGCLTSGMPALDGAIKACKVAGRNVIAETVGDGKACGICGSGAIDVTAELLRNRIIDRNGTFADEYMNDGFRLSGDVVITQKDIREIQKAKAAIRAGIDVLIKKSGIGINDIEKFVIAGSFGEGINAENACEIGLIPDELLPVCATAGNASLGGAVLYALDTGFGARLRYVTDTASVTELSGTPEFDAGFISDMMF